MNYLSKSNKNFVSYLSCHVVRRIASAYLNVCYDRCLKALALKVHGLGLGLGLGLEGRGLGLEIMALDMSLVRFVQTVV